MFFSLCIVRWCLEHQLTLIGHINRMLYTFNALDQPAEVRIFVAGVWKNSFYYVNSHLLYVRKIDSKNLSDS